MHFSSLSDDTIRKVFETVADFSARDISGFSHECRKLALQNIANSNFDQAHFYLALAKEFMLIAIRRKQADVQTSIRVKTA